jgi:hypothetical protein
MPRGNRTGPEGAGPMTGRKMGYCTGGDRPGYARGCGGFHGAGSFSQGRGGRGFRNQYCQSGVPGWGRYSRDGYETGAQEEGEAAYLREKSERLRRSLDEIDTRLKELEQGNAEG